MKRFIKFCLILAAALAVIGVVGIGVGMAMGARPGQFLNLAHYEGSIFRWLERQMCIRDRGVTLNVYTHASYDRAAEQMAKIIAFKEVGTTEKQRKSG